MDRDEKVLRYVQDAMTAQERAAFDVEISNDVDLAAEITALIGARDAMTPTGAPSVATGWAQLSAAIDAETHQPANENRAVRLSLMQAAVVAIAAVTLWQVAVTPLIDGGAAIYAPASDNKNAPGLQVMFSNTATFGEVSVLLNDLEATIVSGPGSLGVYRITFVSEAARQAAQERLAARSDIVTEIMSE